MQEMVSARDQLVNSINKFFLYLYTLVPFYIKKFTKKEKNKRKKKQNEMTKISLTVKSRGTTHKFFFDIPKTELNQHLLNPTKPKTLAVNIKKKHKKIEISKKPLKI